MIIIKFQMLIWTAMQEIVLRYQTKEVYAKGTNSIFD